MTLFYIFYEFFKIGLFAVGGGMAAMPFLYALADKYEWYTHEALIDMIAISESTPGPIGINMATFAGYNAGGVIGSFIATFALLLPSFLIMIGVTKVLTAFSANKYVQNAFYGLRPAVAALITFAGLSIITATLFKIESYHINNSLNLDAFLIFDLKQIILYGILLFVSMKFQKLQSIYIIIFAAIIGAIFKF